MSVGIISASGYNICFKKLGHKGHLYGLGQTELYHLHFKVHRNNAAYIMFYRHIDGFAILY
jgi:hypothetical protein